jgi:hypothetical protein
MTAGTRIGNGIYYPLIDMRKKTGHARADVTGMVSEETVS